MKIIALLFVIFALFSSATSVKNDVCGLTHSMDGEGGHFACDAYSPLWSYKADTNECVTFIYGGCGGNANQFPTFRQCEAMCKE